MNESSIEIQALKSKINKEIRELNNINEFLKKKSDFTWVVRHKLIEMQKEISEKLLDEISHTMYYILNSLHISLSNILTSIKSIDIVTQSDFNENNEIINKQVILLNIHQILTSIKIIYMVLKVIKLDNHDITEYEELKIINLEMVPVKYKENLSDKEIAKKERKFSEKKKRTQKDFFSYSNNPENFERLFYNIQRFRDVWNHSFPYNERNKKKSDFSSGLKKTLFDSHKIDSYPSDSSKIIVVSHDSNDEKIRIKGDLNAYFKISLDDPKIKVDSINIYEEGLEIISEIKSWMNNFINKELN